MFVMDEPTAALTGEESDRLFQLIVALKGRGCGILYVSHRMDEVMRIATRITVLRDGETRATVKTSSTTKSEDHRIDDRPHGERCPSAADILAAHSRIAQHRTSVRYPVECHHTCRCEKVRSSASLVLPDQGRGNC